MLAFSTQLGQRCCDLGQVAGIGEFEETTLQCFAHGLEWFCLYFERGDSVTALGRDPFAGTRANPRA